MRLADVAPSHIRYVTSGSTDPRSPPSNAESNSNNERTRDKRDAHSKRTRSNCEQNEYRSSRTGPKCRSAKVTKPEVFAEMEIATVLVRRDLWSFRPWTDVPFKGSRFETTDELDDDCLERSFQTKNSCRLNGKNVGLNAYISRFINRRLCTLEGPISKEIMNRRS